MIVYGVMIDGAVLEHDDTRYFYPTYCPNLKPAMGICRLRLTYCYLLKYFLKF